MMYPGSIETALPQDLARPSAGQPSLPTPSQSTIGSPVASFDVFDTLVVRAVARPSDVFHLVADHLRDNGILSASAAAGWTKARMAAEASARSSTARQEVTLDDILRVLGRGIGANAHQLQEMRGAELQVERSLWRPVPAGLALVAAARQAGKIIVFLSDMYLPADFIELELRGLGIAVGNERVVVSSATGITKAYGTAYTYLARVLDVEPAMIEHIGDNHLSDVKSARANGVRARQFTGAALSRYEEMIADSPHLPRRTATLLAGAARVARLAMESDCAPDAVHVASVGCGVIAPMTLAFVLWALDRARERGRHIICFLARDGQTPFRVARLIAAATPARYASWTIRYLYASRQAWHPAAIENLDQADLKWLLMDEYGTLTFEDFCRRANVDATAMGDALPSALATDVARSFNAENQQRLAGVLQHDSPSRQLILGAAAGARERALRYLLTQDAADPASTALLDIGWNGTLQRSYERILGLAPDSATGSCGLYVGLVSRPRLAMGSTVDTWFYDHRRRSGAWFCPVGLMEQFFEADHGTTIGYGITPDGSVAPTLATALNAPALTWGLGLQQRAIEATVREFLIHAKPGDLHHLAASPGVRLAAALLDEFAHRPSTGESNCFGAFPKTSGQNHNDARPLGPAVPFKEAIRLGLGLESRNRVVTHWPAGSLVRSGFPMLARVRRARNRFIAIGARAVWRGSESTAS